MNALDILQGAMAHSVLVLVGFVLLVLGLFSTGADGHMFLGNFHLGRSEDSYLLIDTSMGMMQLRSNVWIYICSAAGGTYLITTTLSTG